MKTVGTEIIFKKAKVCTKKLSAKQTVNLMLTNHFKIVSTFLNRNYFELFIMIQDNTVFSHCNCIIM